MKKINLPKLDLKKKTVKKTTWIKVGVGAMALCLVCCTAMSVANAITLGNVDKIVREANGESVDVAQEDGVTIMGEYEIKPTTKISDAYKNKSTDGLNDKEKEVLDLAKDVIKEVIKPKMNDYEKELAIYQWMTANLEADQGALTVIPTTDQDSDNPYGALKYKNAVCVGYATTFRMFMQMMDIECKVVHSADLTHSWDEIKLDGEWYHTDIYSDMGVGNYANFNMTDKMCAVNHEWNTDFFPAADGTKYNYAMQKLQTVDSVYEIPKAMKKALNDNEKILALKFKGGLKEEEAKVGESILRNLSNCLCNVGEYSSFSITWEWVQDDDRNFMAFIYISNTDEYNESGNTTLPEDTVRKIEKAITGTFGDDTGWSYEESTNEEGDH